MNIEKSCSILSKCESISLRNIIMSEMDNNKLLHSSTSLNTQQSFSQMKMIYFNRIAAKLNKLKSEGNLTQYIISLTIKENRSSSENQILSYYISCLKGITYMSSYSSENTIFDLLLKVSNDFGYELFKSDQIVFKKGDIGDRFYIILRGRVSVLVAEENTINLSESEYISYLLKLKKYGENEILLKSISINHGIYKSISDELDKFLRDRECDINKFLKNSPFEVVKEYEDTVSYLNQSRGKETITVNEYIKRISVEIDKNNRPERKPLTIYVYNNLIELNEGDKFGDFSLTFDLKKRTATVITLQDCDFCYLDKTAYEKSLLEMNEKHQRTLINYFLKNPVFKGIDKKKFHMKYFNLLTLQKLNFREKLIQENEEGKYVYFLKSGEYEISMKKKILETEELIKLLEGKEISNINDTENGFEDLRLQKFLNQSKFMKITIINDQEVIGLEDMIDNKGINIFTVTSISYGCEYYRVDRKHFKTVYDNDPFVRTNINNYITIKKRFFYDRLMSIKNILINIFHNENKKREQIEVTKHLERNHDELELLRLGFITKGRSVVTIKRIKNQSTTLLGNSASIKDINNLSKLAYSRGRNASESQLSIDSIKSHSPFQSISYKYSSGYNKNGIIDESVKSIINLTRSVVFHNDNEDQINKVKSSLNILRLPSLSNHSNCYLKNNSTSPLKGSQRTPDKQDLPLKSRNKSSNNCELNLFNKSNNLKVPVYNHKSKVYNNTLFKFSTLMCNGQMN